MSLRKTVGCCTIVAAVVAGLVLVEGSSEATGTVPAHAVSVPLLGVLGASRQHFDQECSAGVDVAGAGVRTTARDAMTTAA